MKYLVGIDLQGQCMPYDEGLLSLVSVFIILIIINAELIEL